MKNISDKTLHFMAGFIIAGLGAFLVSNILYGIILGAIAGVGKEVYDKYVKKTFFDFFDMFATIVGAYAIIPVWEFLIRPFI